MNNKKGFISISVVYALFMLLLVLLLSILSTYAYNRLLLKTTKGDIETDLIHNQDNRNLSFVCKNQKIGSCFAQRYYLDKNLLYHNDTLENGANDGSYRYAGLNPDNYLCFGTYDSAECISNPDKYLYRIIGVYNDQIKIIKESPLTVTKAWGTSGINDWYKSDLATYLNNDFLKSYDSKWQQNLAQIAWEIGGLSTSDGTTKMAHDVLTKEIKNDVNSTLYYSKVGLLYLNEYYYAAEESNWISTNYTGSGNWLNKGLNEYLMSPAADNSTKAFVINANGTIATDTVSNAKSIRPVLYLYQQVKLKDGLGLKDEPYILAE